MQIAREFSPFEDQRRFDREADPFKKRASICSPDSISKEQVKEVLKGSGYPVLSYESHQEEKEPFLYRMKLKTYRKSFEK